MFGCEFVLFFGFFNVFGNVDVDFVVVIYGEFVCCQFRDSCFLCIFESQLFVFGKGVFVIKEELVIDIEGGFWLVLVGSEIIIVK